MGVSQEPLAAEKLTDQELEQLETVSDGRGETA